ncbi:MAG: Pyruvate-flavodoxin oxidoreductase [Candidatus Ozemobacter sibiricus]|uniref:Pyruvate-flavodoxin oxidoreductase n=1 Tax=Candidatus Ozemobacter sibiricus TaxID=2268124 RepID=A0A367ZQH2_9BACT|nr:MAG: Pyruvate-flavodoxin oxidoreductase [Candidatus Ozemobacter sibiricus]
MSETKKTYDMLDGNSAAAYVAHATNEVIAIYPITPSSNMGEMADEKSARGEKNIWGTVPQVVEMQSEGGAAGAVHGSLTTGALTTTFTASQGLLLMIPNMYKIAGELTPTVFHVSARSLACQALSIFGDHSDVMAVRQTGWGLLASGSPQEVMDLALIAQASTLEARVPFVHFFDGFRTSHEVNRCEIVTFDQMRQMLPDELINKHRQLGLTPERPKIRGTAQNPDVYFQGRETVNPYYEKCPAIVQKQMDAFARIVGRQYHLFDYIGAPDAERVVVIMGSGAETMHEVVDYLNAKGEKVGLIKVRLYRPFSVDHMIKAFPATTKAVAVMDRTKEPGALGEPLYIDVRNGIGEALERKIAPFSHWPKVVGGRYGLGSKEFTPAQCLAIFDNLKQKEPKNHFTVGITDDVTHTSLPVGAAVETSDPSTYCAKFYGLGSDGTVGANKDAIKIIGTVTDNYAQGYFVYDSKKSGSMTVSHLRFGKKPLRCPYLITSANFIACHNFSFLEKYDMLADLREGGTFLLESPFSGKEVWDKLPIETQKALIDKKARFYVIDALKIAESIGLGNRINIVMQTAFFEISKILPREVFVKEIKAALKKTYGRKGDEVVQMNCKAVDLALEKLEEVRVPSQVTSKFHIKPPVPETAPTFVKEVLGTMMAAKGDTIPVSKMPDDGTFPTATTQYEKRNVATRIPVWDEKTCVQCGMCALVCPHAAIRTKVYDPKFLEKAPKTFKSCKAMGYKDKNLSFTVQVAPEDCTGCGTCVFVCPAHQKGPDGAKLATKAINMAPQLPLRETERENFKFFLDLPEPDPSLYDIKTIKGSQLVRPLFEFSGACAGCGETPYIKLLTQICGDHLMIANATGCSSIYGGNMPSTPYCQRADGRGPVWSNSLFEDNAEFGMGMRLACDKLNEQALELVKALEQCKCKACVDARPLFEAVKTADQSTPAGIEAQRVNVAKLKDALKNCAEPEARRLVQIADFLIKRSTWIVGGDGWAYDIGYGGLDHVLASGKNVKVLVLDTEVYSNTGGQMSKSTPIGAVAKFAAGGKPMPKKDLAMIAMSYGNIYVARIALGANPAHALKAMLEAEAYDGPALVIAYSHCIAHGIDMEKGLEEQRKAVNSGHWPLLRFNPDLLKEGKNPLQLDSKDPSIPYEEYAYGENRFRSLKKLNPEAAKALLEKAQQEVKFRYNLYKALSELKLPQ